MLKNTLRGYVRMWEGKGGILLQPYFHPELHDFTTDVFNEVLHHLPKRRTFVRLMAYQAWLRHNLEYDLGFREWSQSALMARHTVVKIQTAIFSPLPALEVLGLGGAEPALETCIETNYLNHSQEQVKQLTEWDIK